MSRMAPACHEGAGAAPELADSSHMTSRSVRVFRRIGYRSKYDAQKTLANISATLRQEVSLTELQGQLVAAVKQTLQPIHVSLWIAPRKTVDVLSPESLASRYGQGYEMETPR